jgi:hypothetical protein
MNDHDDVSDLCAPYEDPTAYSPPSACPCRDCDPDFYIDPAELEAGRPDRW